MCAEARDARESVTHPLYIVPWLVKRSQVFLVILLMLVPKLLGG